jgi:NAD(P)-dependent dehydrogenase (short-subunit alcohol dehydrogenase family)
LVSRIKIGFKDQGLDSRVLVQEYEFKDRFGRCVCGEWTMSARLKGKVALITGAGGGLGRAAAIAMAKEGAKIVVSDIAAAAGEETVQLVQAIGGEALFWKTDVTQAKEVKTLIDKTIFAYGALHCAVNNAGYQGKMTATAACAEDEWDRVININLKGVWLCMKYELPRMREQGGGSIVNMSSLSGLRSGLPRFAAYTASKHGVTGLTKSAAVEYARAGIRVNALCPGFVRTSILSHEPSQPLDEFVNSRVPMGRYGTVEEIAEAVVWLCSDASSYMTGHSLIVDGGLIEG